MFFGIVWKEIFGTANSLWSCMRFRDWTLMIYVFIMYIMCLIIFGEKAEIQDQHPLSLNRDRDRFQKYWAILKLWNFFIELNLSKSKCYMLTTFWISHKWLVYQTYTNFYMILAFEGIPNFMRFRWQILKIFGSFRNQRNHEKMWKISIQSCRKIWNCFESFQILIKSKRRSWKRESLNPE